MNYGWDTVITARIRRMGEGNIFTLCVSPHLDWGGEGVPYPRSGQVRYPIPGLDKWGTTSQVWTGGVPHPGSGRGGDRAPPVQTWDLVHPPDLGQVHPQARTGWGTPPGQDWMGYPPPCPDKGWGTPPVQTWDGVPPFARMEWGTPPWPEFDWVPPCPDLIGYPPPPLDRAA